MNKLTKKSLHTVISRGTEKVKSTHITVVKKYGYTDDTYVRRDDHNII